MTEDLKNSISAVVAAALVVVVGYLALRLSDGVEVPRWMPLVALALGSLNLWTEISRWHGRRSKTTNANAKDS